MWPIYTYARASIVHTHCAYIYTNTNAITHTEHTHKQVWKYTYFATTKKEQVCGCRHIIVCWSEKAEQKPRICLSLMKIFEKMDQTLPEPALPLDFSIMRHKTSSYYLTDNEMDFVSVKRRFIKDMLLLRAFCFLERLMIIVPLSAWTSNAGDGITGNNNFIFLKFETRVDSIGKICNAIFIS